MGAQDGWMNEVVKTRPGRGDQLAGRPIDRLSLGRPSYASGEQRVARPYRSGDQTAGQNSARRSRRDRPTSAWNSVGHLRCKWQPLLSEVAYLCRGEGSALERGNPRYAGGMRIEEKPILIRENRFTGTFEWRFRNGTQWEKAKK